MAMFDGDRSHVSAVAVISFAICIVSPDELQAQSAHPFALPVSSPLFNLSSIAALVDVNRDGCSDVIVPGLFIGARLAALDEDGRSLSTNVLGPILTTVPGSFGLSQIVAMAGGRLDGDKLDDLVTVSSNGTVHFHRNLGSTQLNQSNWATDVIIDNFSNAYPAAPPFTRYAFPVAEVFDFDLDGFQDVLIGGAPVDHWSGISQPGFVCIYKGDGQGGFTPQRFDMPGVVIDVAIADLDNDGVDEGLVVLVETGQVGVFSYDLIHLRFSATQLLPVGLNQTIGPGRLVALELANVVGDSNKDYILAQLTVGPGGSSAAIYYYEGDGQGNVNTSSWGTFILPPNVSGMSDHIASIQVADFDRDGFDDIAMLRGYTQGQLTPSSPSSTYSNSEVLVAMGPSLASAVIESIPLEGSHSFADSPTFMLAPLAGQADQLRCMDLGGDSCVDLLVTGLRTGPSGNQPAVLTIKNTTLPQLGDARQLKVGDPSGAVVARPARMGFEGGRPVPGNASYACTIQNVQGGCLVGLLWSSQAIPDLFSTRGVTFHLGPQQFGYALIASGTQFSDGFHSYPLPLPNDPALIGDVGCFQYCYYDHVASAFGGTQATCIWVGN
ncbi:MAG: hypothetical protein ACI89X_001411 [Planctomycetota bacterium]|jgi:hypothetical protein